MRFVLLCFYSLTYNIHIKFYLYRDKPFKAMYICLATDVDEVKLSDSSVSAVHAIAGFLFRS